MDVLFDAVKINVRGNLGLKGVFGLDECTSMALLLLTVERWIA